MQDLIILFSRLYYRIKRHGADMNETGYSFNEVRFGESVWKLWQKRSSSPRINSLLNLDSAGVLKCRPENAHILGRKNENWSVFLVAQGKGSFRVHGSINSFVPGDVIVIAPQLTGITFNISSSFLELKTLRIENSIGVQNLCIRDVPDASLFHPSDFHKMSALHEKIISLMERQTDQKDEADIQLAVFSFLYEVEHQCFEIEHADPVKMIYYEINNFPGKAYSIRELAKKSGLSVRTLQRRFKKQAGCSIQNLITICRIGLARHLLQNTFLSIAEIASSCCYKEVSFFSKAFKLETGISPNEFRKKSIARSFTNTSSLASSLKSQKTGGIKELSPRKKQLLWLINEQRNISILDLAAKLKINPSAVQKHIEALKKDRILRRDGPRRGGFWVISHPQY